ncbi:MAG: hypothetical protein WC595_01995 [Candidatus Nanoarchaeia archaeon]
MKAKKHIHEKKAPIHMMVDQPLLLRKNILSCAIDVTKLLKEYEEFIALKNRKIKTLKLLQREMKSLKTLSKEFNENHFPNVPHELPHQKVERHPTKEEPMNKISIKELKETLKPHKEHKPHLSELDRLNQELRDVESKLGQL